MSNTLLATSDALRRLALNEQVKSYILSHDFLYEPMLHAASVYIGGESLSQCIGFAKNANERGHAVTIDFMGESTRSRADATAATEEFLCVADKVSALKLDASLSLDLSHIGLVVSEELCFENALAIAAAAAAADTELIISAEGTDRTDSVMKMHARLCARVENVGITLQAFLHRTPRDLETVLDRPGKVRIVKGAFDASNHLAMKRGEQLDAAYVDLVRALAMRGGDFSAATHDPAVIDILKPVMHSGRGEFEMLKGVQSHRLDELRATGFRTREYLPYGKEWFLYLCNRLAEHPPAIFDAIAAAFEKV